LRKSYEEAGGVEKRLFGKSNNTTTRSKDGMPWEGLKMDYRPL